MPPQSPYSSTVRYAWSSIVEGARNYGNMLIEWSVRQALDLPEPHITFDSFRPLDDATIVRINAECAFLLSPGCTTLQHGQNVAYDSFGRVRLPKPTFGGCLWQAAITSKLAMATRAFTPAGMTRPIRRAGEVDLTIPRLMSPPVGTRDPFTQDALTAGGVPARFVGCPTLLSPRFVSAWRKPGGDRLVMSLSRASLPTQWRLIRKLAKRWRVSVLVHEPYERKVARLIKGVRLVEFASPEQYMGEYRDADLVVTGRLHGALPAVRHGTPVLFYGDPGDTRFSLLSHLGLPIHPLSAALADSAEAVRTGGLGGEVFDRAYALRVAFVEYAGEFGIPTRLDL